MNRKHRMVLSIVMMLFSLALVIPQVALAGNSMAQVTNSGNIPVLLQVGNQNGGYLLVLVPEGQTARLPAGTISVRALPHDLRPARMGEKIELNLASPEGQTSKIGEIGAEVSLK